jgi:iron complex outermembrane receptor protein
MVTVTAQKEPSDIQRLPVSVTAIPGDLIGRTSLREVGDAAIYAPNTYFGELSARKVSNARFRGIGSSPANPGIATFLDGVPQLNTSTSRVELLDIEQMEFVRGGQSALFGRNALGGIINITSRLPSLDRWTGTAVWESASRDGRGVDASFSGPLAAGKVAVSGAFGARRRDGFSTNLTTMTDVDGRSSAFGKAQLLWVPSAAWQARVIVTGERDRDGDYALADLDALRANAFDVRRDVDGRTERDLLGITAITRREGTRVTFSTTTGIVRWNTRDVTDLDYGPLPLVTRDNREEALQFTQEVRLASAAASPLSIGTRPLRWQAGVFVFAQDYEQDAINSFSPSVLSEFVPFPVEQHSPRAALDDAGIGVFGHATLSVTTRTEVSAGLRFDHESKDADLETFFSPQIAPDARVTAGRSFTSLSPQVSAAFRLTDDRMLYASAGKGFKAGGFNPASPAGSEAYGEERAWHLEGGMKSLWANRRATLNAAAFYIDWNDLQLNLPDPAVPGQFYIANVGGARSAGAELELRVRAHESLDLLGAFGRTASQFASGSRALGADVSGNDLPGTPGYTATVAAESSVALAANASVYGRAEAVFYGAFKFDELNAVGQEAYSLTNLRAGVRVNRLFVEAWVRNAFDARYIPIAFAYPGFAPSGYVGEPGRPRTFGVSGGVGF